MVRRIVNMEKIWLKLFIMYEMRFTVFLLHDGARCASVCAYVWPTLQIQRMRCMNLTAFSSFSIYESDRSQDCVRCAFVQQCDGDGRGRVGNTTPFEWRAQLPSAFGLIEWDVPAPVCADIIIEKNRMRER